jgi:hypothetical protein
MFQAEAVHRQEAPPRLLVAETLQPPAELAPRESQLIDQWVSHGNAPCRGSPEINNAPPEVISGGAFPSAHFPLYERLLKQSLQNLDENNGDDERKIEHANRGNHPPQRGDDRLSHFR